MLVTPKEFIMRFLLAFLLGCSDTPATAADTFATPFVPDTDDQDPAPACEISAAVHLCENGEFLLGLVEGAMIMRLDQLDENGQGVELSFTPVYLDPEESASRVNITAACEDGLLVRATVLYCR